MVITLTMILLFLALAIGMLLGLVFPQLRRWEALIDLILLVVIFLIIFSLGWQVASEHNIVDLVQRFGIQGFLIASAAIVGSILFTFFL
jgi:TRAP-type C4-dicarboxylate transport system permease small subunit